MDYSKFMRDLHKLFVQSVGWTISFFFFHILAANYLFNCIFWVIGNFNTQTGK